MLYYYFGNQFSRSFIHSEILTCGNKLSVLFKTRKKRWRNWGKWEKEDNEGKIKDNYEFSIIKSK